MPYIGVSTSKKLSDAQKDALKSALGEKISVIPGKTEKALMVDIADGHTAAMAQPSFQIKKRSLRRRLRLYSKRPDFRRIVFI